VFLPGEVSQAAKREYEVVVTTNCEKSAEAIVPDWDIYRLGRAES